MSVSAYTTNQIIRMAAENDKTKTVNQIKRDYFSNPQSGNANKKPMISFTFDDGHVTNYTHAFPHFYANGFRATEFLNCSTTDVDSTRLTSAQIKELSHAGWEMACHTFNHANLTELTDTGIMDELTENKQFIEELIQKPVHTHGIPFGQHDARVRHMISGVYEATRKTQKRYMSYGEIENLDQCPGWFFDTLTLTEMQVVVDDLMNEEEPKWLIVAMHGISSQETHPDLVTEGDLISLLQYIRTTYAENNLVDVVPFYEGARRIQS